MNMEKTLSWWMGCSGVSMVWDRPSLTLRVGMLLERLKKEVQDSHNECGKSGRGRQKMESGVEFLTYDVRNR